MKRILAAIFSALLLVLGGFSNAASAHDAVSDTYPLRSKTVSAGLFYVEITFGEKILNTENNSGLAIEVYGPLDKKPTLQSNECVNRSLKSMKTPVDLDKDGVYRVTWRSVSSDGHPTEGEYTFKVKNSNDYVSSGVPKVDNNCKSLKPTTNPTSNKTPLPKPSSSASKTAAFTDTASASASPAPSSSNTTSAGSQPTETSSSSSIEQNNSGQGLDPNLIGLIIALFLVAAGSILGAVTVDRRNKKNGVNQDRRYE